MALISELFSTQVTCTNVTGSSGAYTYTCAASAPDFEPNVTTMTITDTASSPQMVIGQQYTLYVVPAATPQA